MEDDPDTLRGGGGDRPVEEGALDDRGRPVGMPEDRDAVVRHAERPDALEEGRASVVGVLPASSAIPKRKIAAAGPTAASAHRSAAKTVTRNRTDWIGLETSRRKLRSMAGDSESGCRDRSRRWHSRERHAGARAARHPGAVTVGEEEVGAIGAGLLVLLGVADGDGEALAPRLAEKTARLRIFPDAHGRFDRSLLDTGGDALVVSQFTLIADTAKGNRPSFTHAAAPEDADRWWERFCAALGLGLGAALLVALWNLLLAGSRGVLAAFAVALCASLIVAAPFAVLAWGIERDAIPWLRASAALECAYFFTLTAAYQRSELSLVYPLARGGAPVLVLLGALATGVVPTGWETAGVLAVAAGVVLVRRDRGWRPSGCAARDRDRGPDRRLHARRRGGDPPRRAGAVPPARPESPTAVGAALVSGRERLRAELRPTVVLAGCGGFLAYVLVTRGVAARSGRAGRRRAGDERALRRGPRSRRLLGERRHGA